MPIIEYTYRKTDDGISVVQYGESKSVGLLHLLYEPSNGSSSDLYVASSEEGIEMESCGWRDLPCQTLCRDTPLPLHSWFSFCKDKNGGKEIICK